ncbi:GntR family transcriptional regulator [Pacificoceanicola onchidii]|uniref:GntR family transcriptional regulator n=1 Tax=Pacificoceanicola onchidii TaxID=2562685 RepID=UPI0010A443E4|nr:GntR family transcriptional regulator [Pacificoceanicola onchidii]
MNNEPGPVEAVDTRSLAERVYDQLRQSLLQGKLRAGQSMTIRSMAKALGTSEMPVRESMKRLLAERMIVQRANRTYQVPALERSEFVELTSIRVSLEGSAARQAVENADDALIGKMTRHNLEMKSNLAEGNSAGVLAANQEFHFALYRASGSEILLQLIELLWMRSGPYLAEALAEIRDAEDFFSRATETHDRLINALIARDEDGVFNALKDDLESSAHRYEKHIASKLEDSEQEKIVPMPKASKK